MCLRPLRITNVTKDFTFADAKYLYISCNECEECRQQRKNDYFVRIQEELRDRRPQDNWRLFLTLTFNDEHLPKYTFNDNLGEEISFYGFDSKLIRGLFAKLQDVLKNKYGIIGNKWIACPEFGETTQRPHYHCIFICKKVGLFKELTIEELYKLIHSYWDEIGFICPRDPYGCKELGINPAVIEDALKSARYISKYCLKETFFYKLNPTLHDTYKQFVKIKDDPFYVEWCQNYRRAMPRVLTSLRFGACIDERILMSKCPQQEYNKGLQTMDDEKRSVKFPQYTLRRLMKQARLLYKEQFVDVFGKERTRYVYRYDNTPLCVSVKKEQFDSNIENFKQNIRLFQNCKLPLQREWLEEHPQFKDILTKSNDIDLDVLSYYNYVYRHRVVSPFVYNSTNGEWSNSIVLYSDDTKSSIINVARKRYDYILNYKRTINETINANLFKDEELFSSYYCFYGCETLLSSYENYQKAQRPKIYRSRRDEFQLNNWMRSYYRNFGRMPNGLEINEYKSKIKSNEVCCNNIDTSCDAFLSKEYESARLANSSIFNYSNEFRIPTDDDFNISSFMRSMLTRVVEYKPTDLKPKYIKNNVFNDPFVSNGICPF